MTMIVLKNRYQAEMIHIFLATRGIRVSFQDNIVLAPISKNLAMHLIRFAMVSEKKAIRVS